MHITVVFLGKTLPPTLPPVSANTHVQMTERFTDAKLASICVSKVFIENKNELPYLTTDIPCLKEKNKTNQMDTLFSHQNLST